MKEEKKYICDCFYDDLEENHCSCYTLHDEETKKYFENNKICGYYDAIESTKQKRNE